MPVTLKTASRSGTSERLESSAVSTGEDYRPFMFAFHGDSLACATAVNHFSWDRVAGVPLSLR